MSEEIPLHSHAIVDFANPINLTTVVVDKNLFSSATDGYTITSTNTVDKNFGSSIGTNVNLEITTTKDSNLHSSATGARGTKLEGMLASDRGQRVEADLGAVELNIYTGVDKLVNTNTDLGAVKISSALIKDLAIKAEGEVAQNITLDVERFERSLLTLPPSGQLYLQNSVDLRNSSINFDCAEVSINATHILQLEAVGTRLETYLIEFFARLNPHDKPVIHKASNNTVGGIDVLGVPEPIAASSGTSQKLIAQIRLNPKDTTQFAESTTLFYQVVMSNRGLNEEYLVAPISSETGTFKVIVKNPPKQTQSPYYYNDYAINRNHFSQEGGS